MSGRARWRTAVAGGLALLCVGIVALAVRWLRVSPTASEATFLATMSVLGLTSAVLGVVVVVRRPDNLVGPVLAGVGLIPCLIGLNDTYVAIDTRIPYRLPISTWEMALTAGAWMFIYVPAGLLFLTFPDGRLIGRRWRVPTVALVVVPVVYSAASAVTIGRFPRPYGRLPDPVPSAHGAVRVTAYVVQGLSLIGFLGLLGVSFAALVVRYRTADATRRAQLKWLGLAATFLPGTLLLCWLSYLVLNGPDLVDVGLIGLFLSIPITTTVAILRHDLYDIDRALSATVTYTLVTAALLATFTVMSFLGGLELGRGSPVVAAAATAICAAALSPLRRRLRDRVDRRLYPLRRQTLDALETLRTRVNAGVGRPEELAEVLRRALDDPTLRVGYRVPGSPIDVDADGRPVDGPGVVVQLAGEPVGRLVTAPDRPRALIREVAESAAMLVEVVRLRSGLSQAVRDVESSRSRLLRAGYDERRRLERDLHDGAQQRLVALGMSLRVAQRHLEDGTVDVHQLLDASVDELAAAVADLRMIARGLRPSSLDDGLGPALTGLISRLPVPVTASIDNGKLSDEVATTAYFVASEAIANAIKHARADQIALAVHHTDDDLVVRIVDDGAGGATIRAGSGLAGLGDRVAAAGGVIHIDSPPGAGTTVEATLPCVS